MSLGGTSMVVLLSGFNWNNMHNRTQYFESVCRTCGLALRECFPSGIALIYGVVKKTWGSAFCCPPPSFLLPHSIPLLPPILTQHFAAYAPQPLSDITAHISVNIPRHDESQMPGLIASIWGLCPSLPLWDMEAERGGRRDEGQENERSLAACRLEGNAFSYFSLTLPGLPSSMELLSDVRGSVCFCPLSSA